MRIVLKPAGAAALIMAFVSLAALIVWRSSQNKRADALAEAPAHTATGTPMPPYPSTIQAPTSENELQNRRFEEGYGPVRWYDNKATLTGTIANHWYDDSSWAKVTVDYAWERREQHTGAVSQKITIHKMESTPTAPAAVQFVQPVRLTAGKKYTAGFWLRADRTTKIEVLLRQAPTPYTPYCSTLATIGTTWQHVLTSGTAGLDPNTYLMLRITTPGTVWIDDAALVLQSGHTP